jgi:uncharacterized sporulation protein YeaH/YhbH (DUF444 family)
MNPAQDGWYELFSRGARDWLRHNSKVREAVRSHLPDLIAGPDLITGPHDRTIQVPVRLLEHARFRLADGRSLGGAGQGQGNAGDIVRPARAGEGPPDGAGQHDGDIRLMLEFAVDDVMDWLWEEMHLPHLKPRRDADARAQAPQERTSPDRAAHDQELVRAGWDKRGARSRLDRRRTVKEAIKRRAMQGARIAFTNDDLRYRQLHWRPQPGSQALVFFVIDVSASMSQAERTLAKSFFFLALQGLRRQYAAVEIRFIGHTTRAWEFAEHEFFQVNGIGGTLASSAFRLTLELAKQRRDMVNVYMFYASDGENFTEDRSAADQSLTELGRLLNYIAYVETAPGMPRAVASEMQRLCNALQQRGLPVASSILVDADDVWPALRKFLAHQSDAVERDQAS